MTFLRTEMLRRTLFALSRRRPPYAGGVRNTLSSLLVVNSKSGKQGGDSGKTTEKERDHGKRRGRIKEVGRRRGEATEVWRGTAGGREGCECGGGGGGEGGVDMCEGEAVGRCAGIGVCANVCWT